MDIRTLFEALMLCREAKLTPFIWGHSGMGKSTTVQDFAKYITGRNNDSEEPACVDLRCAQMEASDIRGIPAPEDGRTKYYVPKQFPTEENRGVLFLDEINRSEDDVMHATFELVLDRRVGEYRVPKSWSIVCAGNYSEGDYTVNAFNDFAFLDRFVHLELTKDDEYDRQWTKYMTNKFSDDAVDRVAQFVAGNSDRMLGQVSGDLGFTRRPTPRSWEAVTRVEQAYAKGMPLYQNGTPVIGADGKPVRKPYDIETYMSVITGLIGGALAREYTTFSMKIFPRDIANDGVKKHENILNDLCRGELIGLMWGCSALANGLNPGKKKKEAKNIIGFINYIANRQRDLALMLVKGILKDEVNSSASGLISRNKGFAKMINKASSDTDSWASLLTNDKNVAELTELMNTDADIKE